MAATSDAAPAAEPAAQPKVASPDATSEDATAATTATTAAPTTATITATTAATTETTATTATTATTETTATTATTAAPTATTAPTAGAEDDTNPIDFAGAVHTDNQLPTAETLRAVADLPVLDRNGQSRTFKSLYAAAPGGRVLFIFVRHFFCGNCQEYLRTLSAAIPASALTVAVAAGEGDAVPTTIVVIGCGEPPLIDMYAEASQCAYPIYADPTRRLYDALGMVRTLALGPQKPAYMQGASMWASIVRSIGQGLRQVPRGLATKGGNQRQVGGEFLFETTAAAAVDVKNKADAVKVTWCHRMKTTRDHAEADELKAVLGLK